MAAQRKEINPNTVVAVGVVGVLGYAAWRMFGRPSGGGGVDGPLLPPNVVVPVITVPPTMTRQDAQVIADVIYTAFYGDGFFWSGNTTEDEAAVVAAMSLAGNDADVALIIDAYGVRGGRWSFHGDMNLVQAIVTFLSASDRAVLNDYYRSNGIGFRL